MSIVLERLTKRYDGVAVVHQVSLEVADGELFVLLGPSGSGKSTVLRMVAGLTPIEEGRVRLNDRDVTFLPPQRRGVGFVFQHYALFHHMTVAENIEFGLRIRRAAREERRRTRDELLDLVGLGGMGGRYPRQLSGGQQQRVALARALAFRPEVLLLDEPFGALDAKIRADLRRALLQIQRELKVTTVFVTHDQEEAFELADRIGVMNVGRLLEVGPPKELYLRPRTEFVATFLGTANLIVGEVQGEGIRIGPARFPLGTELADPNRPQRVQVLFRPEDVAVKDGAEALNWPLLGQAVVEQTTFTGSFERLRLRFPSLAGVRPISPPVPYGSEFVVEATRSEHQARRFPLAPGDRPWVGIRRLHALAHPGMSFLLLADGSPSDEGALELGGQIGRLAHARVTVLGCGRDEGWLAEAREAGRRRWGAGTAALDWRISPQRPVEALAEEIELIPRDLVVAGLDEARNVDRAGRLLTVGEHHLLLTAAPALPPTRALICVTVGEPAKEEVLFAGRLIRHFGAEARVLTVLPAGAGPDDRDHAARFLEAGIRTLALLGVPARARVRAGETVSEILSESEEGGHDLLVLGAPLPGLDGRVHLEGVVADCIRQVRCPVLVVRSAYATAPAVV